MEVDYELVKNKILSYSRLKTFQRSPMHFYYDLTHKREATKAQKAGSLVDKMILTPDTWKEEFAVQPEKPPFLKDLVEKHGKEQGRILYDEGKANMDKWMKDNAGKTFITQEELDEAKLITEKVFENPAAKELLSKVTSTQVQVRWTDKKTGLEFIGYLDGEGEGFVLELKTAQDADPDSFTKDAVNYDYHLQGAMYLEAIKLKKFLFPKLIYLVVEKKAPYGVTIMEADDDYIKLGLQLYRRLCDGYKHALDNKLFHMGYEYRALARNGTHSLMLPPWKRKELED